MRKKRQDAGSGPLVHCEHVYEELGKESDRGLAIVGASWLDHLLADCLKLKLQKPKKDEELNRLFEAEGPIGSFSVRCKLAYYLNIINDDTLHDLRIINNIRRSFAHYTSANDPKRKLQVLSFKHNTVANGVKSLRRSKELVGKLLLEQGDETSRDFLRTVLAIGFDLMGEINKRILGRHPRMAR